MLTCQDDRRDGDIHKCRDGAEIGIVTSSKGTTHTQVLDRRWSPSVLTVGS